MEGTETLENGSEQQPKPDSASTETTNGTTQTPLSAEESQQKKIQDLEAQVKEKEAKYLYLYAEFDNFKKRTVKDRSDLLKFGWESVALNLLQVLDNLERALDHVPINTDNNLVKGLEMVVTQFKSTFEKQGVQRIETIGKSFDPNIHEAIGQEPSPKPSGTITQEQLGGYTIHGRLLRAPRVVVSQGNPVESPAKFKDNNSKESK